MVLGVTSSSPSFWRSVHRQVRGRWTLWVKDAGMLVTRVHAAGTILGRTLQQWSIGAFCRALALKALDEKLAALTNKREKDKSQPEDGEGDLLVKAEQLPRPVAIPVSDLPTSPARKTVSPARKVAAAAGSHNRPNDAPDDNF